MGHNVAFILLTFVATQGARRLGWRASRGHLYTLPLRAALPLCVLWGGSTAAFFKMLILWLEPHAVILWIFGYAQGAYASIPNYGLINELTIPPEAKGRHSIVSNVPLLSYVIIMIALAYLY